MRSIDSAIRRVHVTRPSRTPADELEKRGYPSIVKKKAIEIVRNRARLEFGGRRISGYLVSVKKAGTRNFVIDGYAFVSTKRGLPAKGQETFLKEEIAERGFHMVVRADNHKLVRFSWR